MNMEPKRRKLSHALQNGEDPVVTAWDVVNEMNHLTEEAKHAADSSWGDENACSHDEGYIDQAVYSCLACAPKLGRRFGFCYACSLNCHIDHVIPVEDEDGNIVEKDAIIELFDKRSFRCDCPCTGACKLFQKEADDGSTVATPGWNDENEYNHNYDGLYCWCNQPYDHDSDIIMVQCELCQDWYHQQCIETETGTPIPVDEDEDDENAGGEGDNNKSDSEEQGSSSQFVCRNCVHKFSFLQKYAELIYVKRAKDSPPLINSLIDSTSCHIQRKEATIKGSVFFRRGWKNLVCRCTSCSELYTAMRIDKVLAEDFPSDDDEDGEENDATGDVDGHGRGLKRKRDNSSSLADSATMGPESNPPPAVETPSQGLDLVEAGMSQLKQLPFMQQVDMLHHYNHMRSSLGQFFQKFAVTGQVVTQQDVVKFFDNLKGSRQQQPPPS
eukprot:TRINITY_DN15236_c0_g1_i1.p1 TRINITY_DN15236_c0_g1~~TRINITY_DN15236_c0_g1_i1.p1  ORF type:complete len:441 (-),score=86.53 TRINITY_DN15236_c0_g1_i1:37-1359(-)